MHMTVNLIAWETFEDTKWKVRNSKLKEGHYNGHKRTKGETMIYKTLHRELKIEQHEPH